MVAGQLEASIEDDDVTAAKMQTMTSSTAQRKDEATDRQKKK